MSDTAAQRIEIETADAKLEGWWIENAQATTPAVILYFGGNAEDVLYTASTARQIDARAVVVVNYRGYGGSTGKPGQKALYDDGLAIYDYAIKRGVPAEHIVVMGRSLGSGVASMLAGARPVRAAILITPYRQSRRRRGNPLSVSAGATAPASSVPVIRMGRRARARLR